MNDVAEPPALSTERVLTGTILHAFPWNGERRFVSARSIPISLWTELVSAARQNGLAALLFASLSDTADPNLPAEPLAELRDIFLRSRMANRLANDVLGGVLDSFTLADVPLLILKGAALSAILYPQLGLRPFGDIDVMIHVADLARAREILAKRGLNMLVERHTDFLENDLKSLIYTTPDSLGPPVELHWHLFAPIYYRRRVSMEFFWRNPFRFTVAGRDAYALSPLQQLVHLTAHAGLHTHVPLIWLYDMARWINQFQSEIEWDEFVRTVQILDLTGVVSRNLSDSVLWWGAAVPPVIIDRLLQSKSGAGARLVSAIYSSPQSGARILVNLLYQEGLSNKIGYAVRLLFPSREYMETHQPFHSRESLPVLYAQRIWRIAWFVLRSLWVTLMRAGGNK